MCRPIALSGVAKSRSWLLNHNMSVMQKNYSLAQELTGKAPSWCGTREPILSRELHDLHYISDKVKVWTSYHPQLILDRQFKTRPHAAYCAFVHGYLGFGRFPFAPNRTYRHSSSHLRMQSGSISFPLSQDVTASVILRGTFSLFQHTLVVLPYLTPLY